MTTNSRASWVRRVLVLALIAAFLCVSPDASAAGRSCHGLRFTEGLDDLQVLVEGKMPQKKSGKKDKRVLALKGIHGKLRRCMRSLKQEFATASAIAHIVESRGRTTTDGPGILEGELGGEMTKVAAFYDDRAQEEVDRMVLLIANLRSQGFEVTKQEEHLAKANEGLAYSRTQTTPWTKLRSLVGVIKRTTKLLRATRVSKEKPKCEGRRLKKGEYCNAIVGGQVAHFQVGKGTIQLDRDGNVSRVRLMFHSCPTRSFTGATILFSVPPTLGVHDAEGDTFTRGDGSGFGLRMKEGSTLTITAIDLEQGLIAGHFQFTTAGSNADNSQFRLTSVK